MRALGVGEKVAAIGPLSQAQIKTLPLCIYVAKGEDPDDVDGSASTGVATPAPGAEKRQSPFWRLLRSRKTPRQHPATGFVVPSGVQLLPLTQHMATCAICLSGESFLAISHDDD